MDWDEMARPWLDAAPDLEIALRPVLDALVFAAQLSNGDHVLDVGCGTGPSLADAVAAVGPTGSVTGVDIAPPLVAAAAKRLGDRATVLTGDAESYPFEKAKFDVVQANFGIMFFQDSAAAFSNLRRATKNGGRLAATVWAGPKDNPWFSVPRQIVDGIVSDVPKPDPSGPGPMRFAEPSHLLHILTEAGWEPTIETQDIELTPPGPAEQVAALHLKVTAGMMLKGVEVTEQQLEEIEAALVAACRDHTSDGAVKFPARIHVITAVANG